MTVKTSFLQSIASRFYLTEDRASEERTIAEIKKGVEFRGINSWLLIFAIFIASIGLNVNSTAVVIGAMLLSPLMGPIMGIGLGVGIYDAALLRKSFTNLFFMAAVSLATSTLYFAATPIHTASSELLARTTPTIWDVAIALIGGLAGIVAGSSKSKGNTLTGVAIATALMPPLCTAGYGLANGRLDYFIGAFYLFSINAVMIGFATAITVRYLGFKTVASGAPNRYVRLVTNAVVAITVLPSVWLGYRIVQKSLFENRVAQFISGELAFPEAQPILRNLQMSPSRSASILLVGEPVLDSALERARSNLGKYRLKSGEIVLRQGNYASIANALKDSLVSESNGIRTTIQLKDAAIHSLRARLDSADVASLEPGETARILAELHAIDSTVERITLGRLPTARLDSNETRRWICLVEAASGIDQEGRRRLQAFLRKRLEQPDLIVEILAGRAFPAPDRKPSRSARK